MRYLLLIGILFVTACTDDVNAEDPVPESLFYELNGAQLTSYNTYTNKQSKVIKNQRTYNDELSIYSNRVATDIDFSKNTVLLVDMGQRNTGGYNISVTGINVYAQHIVADVTLVKPGANCIVTDSLTNPYQFVAIPTTKEVLINENIVNDICR